MLAAAADFFFNFLTFCLFLGDALKQNEIPFERVITFKITKEESKKRRNSTKTRFSKSCVNLKYGSGQIMEKSRVFILA